MQSYRKKTILITGGNKGIGFGMIHGLFKKGNPNKFILTSRNEELGKDSVNKLITEFLGLPTNSIIFSI